MTDKIRLSLAYIQTKKSEMIFCCFLERERERDSLTLLTFECTISGVCMIQGFCVCVGGNFANKALHKSFWYAM